MLSFSPTMCVLILELFEMVTLAAYYIVILLFLHGGSVPHTWTSPPPRASNRPLTMAGSPWVIAVATCHHPKHHTHTITTDISLPGTIQKWQWVALGITGDSMVKPLSFSQSVSSSTLLGCIQLYPLSLPGRDISYISNVTYPTMSLPPPPNPSTGCRNSATMWGRLDWERDDRVLMVRVLFSPILFPHMYMSYRMNLVC